MPIDYLDQDQECADNWDWPEGEALEFIPSDDSEDNPRSCE